jgi:N6-adenosine-specific RNA methylase IME4
MDPPWPEQGAGKIKRGANRHYPLLPVSKIRPTILESGVWRPAESCHLYMWVTNNYFTAGLRIGEELGFRHIHPITWAKTRSGLGQYRGGQTEHLLFFVKGKAMLPRKKLAQTTLLGRGLISATKHSKKPVEQYHTIEDISPGPRLEMFATEVRFGWYTWGELGIIKNEQVLVHTTRQGEKQISLDPASEPTGKRFLRRR